MNIAIELIKNRIEDIEETVKELKLNGVSEDTKGYLEIYEKWLFEYKEAYKLLTNETKKP